MDDDDMFRYDFQDSLVSVTLRKKNVFFSAKAPPTRNGL